MRRRRCREKLSSAVKTLPTNSLEGSILTPLFSYSLCFDYRPGGHIPLSRALVVQSTTSLLLAVSQVRLFLLFILFVAFSSDLYNLDN